jgi:hypothetical protein
MLPFTWLACGEQPCAAQLREMAFKNRKNY